MPANKLDSKVGLYVFDHGKLNEEDYVVILKIMKAFQKHSFVRYKNLSIVTKCNPSISDFSVQNLRNLYIDLDLDIFWFGD